MPSVFPEELDDFENPTDNNVFDVSDISMSHALLEAWAINSAQVAVKFKPSVKVSSITNERFTLVNNTATPNVESDDPFEDIDIARDYNSISRTLVLTWKDDLLIEESSYILVFNGFRTATNVLIDEDAIYFVTGEEVEPSPGEIPPEPPQVQIVDFSLIPNIVDTNDIDNLISNPNIFGVLETDPINGEYYLASDFNNGRVIITLSKYPNVDFINDTYIKVQKRIIDRKPSRWESVTATITLDPDDPLIYIDFPSDDATPLFNVSGSYFDENYKYRIILSKSIEVEEGATPTSETILTDYVLLFSGIISPMCLDPDELVGHFPEATYLEIAEAIRNATLDLQYILKLKSDECSSHPLAYEYIKAAAACALSRVYGNGDLIPGGDVDRIKLGDLEVEKGGSSGFSTTRGRITPETATTWCELAFALRKEITMRGVGMRAVVKGSIYHNPIPRRHFKPDAGNWPRHHNQGDLDDMPDTKNWS